MFRTILDDQGVSQMSVQAAKTSESDIFIALTPLDFQNSRVCSVNFRKILNFFDDCVGLTQRPLEAKDRRPKPHWSGAGAVSIFGPIFTYINYNGVL